MKYNKKSPPYRSGFRIILIRENLITQLSKLIDILNPDINHTLFILLNREAIYGLFVILVFDISFAEILNGYCISDLLCKLMTIDIHHILVFINLGKGLAFLGKPTIE